MAGIGGLVLALLAIATLSQDHLFSSVPQRGEPALPPAFASDMWQLPDETLHGFVRIPAGQFPMGSERGRDTLAFDNEFWADGARHNVDAAEFYISRYEVTVGQFRVFVKATNYKVHQLALAAPDNHPVTHVSWPDALAYTRWLNTQLREHPRLARQLADVFQRGWQVTLPTEIQWEKAARGVDGRVYPWGNVARRDRANYRSDRTAAVGIIPCSECAHGLLDMSGNVWEWTRTPFRPGPYLLEEPPVDLNVDALWVMRGGSFMDTEQNIRAATRGGADPGVRKPFIGFRVVISAVENGRAP
jgi:formylglycine-generating enzyme required for sulfatase activity